MTLDDEEPGPLGGGVPQPVHGAEEQFVGGGTFAVPAHLGAGTAGEAGRLARDSALRLQARRER